MQSVVHEEEGQSAGEAVQRSATELPILLHRGNNLKTQRPFGFYAQRVWPIFQVVSRGIEMFLQY